MNENKEMERERSVHRSRRKKDLCGQGDQMSLFKSRQKRSPTYLWAKLLKQNLHCEKVAKNYRYV
jgi:hypothetical protein